jgi:hypothetical protein
MHGHHEFHVEINPVIFVHLTRVTPGDFSGTPKDFILSEMPLSN